MTSCNTTRGITESKIGQSPTIMTETDMKEILGLGYYQDSVIKKLHLFNTSDVSWNAESKQVKVFVDIQDGRVLSTKNKTQDMFSGFLPAGTEGMVDSIVRYNTKNIWKLKIHYIIKQNGRSVYIWYYRKDDPMDPSLRWYQCNNNQIQTIEGVALSRATLDNKLQWMFSVETKQKTNKKGFDVISPFASTSADGVNTPGKPSIQKAEEEEEKN